MKIKRLYLGLCGAVGLAGVGLWVSTAWFTYSVALTHSLPGHVYAINRDAPVQKGDLVAFVGLGAGFHWGAGLMRE